MPITIKIPTQLRPLTGSKAEVEAAGGTVSEVIADLESRHPGLSERLLEGGAPRRFVNIYVDNEDIRFQEGLQTRVGESSQLTIIPAVAGG